MRQACAAQHGAGRASPARAGHQPAPSGGPGGTPAAATAPRPSPLRRHRQQVHAEPRLAHGQGSWGAPKGRLLKLRHRLALGDPPQAAAVAARGGGGGRVVGGHAEAAVASLCRSGLDPCKHARATQGRPCHSASRSSSLPWAIQVAPASPPAGALAVLRCQRRQAGLARLDLLAQLGQQALLVGAQQDVRHLQRGGARASAGQAAVAGLASGLCRGRQRSQRAIASFTNSFPATRHPWGQLTSTCLAARHTREERCSERRAPPPAAAAVAARPASCRSIAGEERAACARCWVCWSCCGWVAEQRVGMRLTRRVMAASTTVVSPALISGPASASVILLSQAATSAPAAAAIACRISVRLPGRLVRCCFLILTLINVRCGMLTIIVNKRHPPPATGWLLAPGP